MKKLFIYLLPALVALASCEDKAPKTFDPLSPDDNKEKLDAVAMEAMALANTEDFKTITNAVNDVINEVGDSYIDIPEEVYNTFEAYLEKFENIESFEEFLNPNSDIYFDYTEYFGTYTFSASKEAWKIESNNKNITVIVGDAKVVITPTGKQAIDNGRDKEVPTKIEVALTHGSTKLANATIKIEDLNYSDQSVSTSIKVEAAGFTFEMAQTLKKKTLTYDRTVSKGKTMIVNSTVTVDNAYVDTSYGVENVDESDVTIGKALATTNILNQVFLKAECADVMGLYDAESDLYEEYPLEDKNWEENNVYYHTWSRPEAFYKEWAKTLNNSLSASWGFGTKAEDQGYLIFDYEENEPWYWIIPIMVFEEDGSKYAFEDYFTEDAFGDVIDQAMDLIEDFEDFFEDEFDF